MTNKTTFKLQIYCMTGWDDNEEIGELEIDTFSEVLHVINVLKTNECFRGISRETMNEHQKAYVNDYQDIKSDIEVPSGEEVFSVCEVVGITAHLESADGITVRLTLDDDSGVSSSHRVNGEKYESEYKERMRQAKKLAAQIARL